jgi:hypothetical protein
MSEGELGQVFSFACASIGDTYLMCRCAQNGKACFASILLADVVSVSSRVVCYHDGLLVAAVLMYSVVCGADMLVLVDLLNCPVECGAQTVCGITRWAKPMLVVPRLVWAALIAIRFLLFSSALAKRVRSSSARVMLLSRNRLSLSRRRRSVCLMCCPCGVLMAPGVRWFCR